jgi:hypothetical protein
MNKPMLETVFKCHMLIHTRKRTTLAREIIQILVRRVVTIIHKLI